VYAFIENVLRDRKPYEIYGKVEALRRELLRSNERLEVVDLGAGSRKDNQQSRRVGDIVRSAAKPKKYGQLLYRTARHYGCRNLLELGTSLGITTAYLAAGAGTEGKVVTIEGAPAIAAKAAEQLRRLGAGNVVQLVGDFDERLPEAFGIMPSPELVYIDGNHRKEPTLRYFQLLKERCGEQAILVFDDIHWSRGMEEAWAAIRGDDEVTCTIDLFHVGFVFFRRSFREKVDFMIRY
jgi:predicted O-methyltransferase YrrM